MKINAVILGIIGGVFYIIISIPFLKGHSDTMLSVPLGFFMLFCGIVGLIGAFIFWQRTTSSWLLLLAGSVVILGFISILYILPALPFIISSVLGLVVESREKAQA